jgi:hypothetical protein
MFLKTKLFYGDIVYGRTIMKGETAGVSQKHSKIFGKDASQDGHVMSASYRYRAPNTLGMPLLVMFHERMTEMVQ